MKQMREVGWTLFVSTLSYVVLAGLLLHLAARISVLDTRCRRLTQEVSLLTADLETRLCERTNPADLRPGK